MRLIKVLMIFLVFGSAVLVVMSDIGATPRMLSVENLLFLYFYNAPVVFISWVVYVFFGVVAHMISMKFIVLKRFFYPGVFSLWSICAASLAYLISFGMVNVLCRIHIAHSLGTTCGGVSDDKLALFLIFGVVCGGLSSPILIGKKLFDISGLLCSLNVVSVGGSMVHGVRGVIEKIWWTLPIAFTITIFVLFYKGVIPVVGATVEERGQFGDSFGVLNSLFSGLAFGGLIITLLFQQKQISHQEKESVLRREFEESKQYEEVFYRLLTMYSNTLSEVSSNNGALKGRSVLRGSIDRAYRELKHNKVSLIPQPIQSRYEKNSLSETDVALLDYIYFRNFKIITVEIERQARLVETFKLLLRHTVRNIPSHLDGQAYFELIQAQITYVEASYFFFVALAFTDECDLRALLNESSIVEKMAHTKRLRVHEIMYKEFWGDDIRKYKKQYDLPMSGKRINKAIRAYKQSCEEAEHGDLRVYTAARVRDKPSLP